MAQQVSDPQMPGESANPVTTIQSRADLVLVPVVVRDKEGKHVTGLSKDAFQLEENGKPQTLSLFEELQAPDAGSTPSAELDRGYSNLPFDNTSQLRLTIIVLDLLNTHVLQRTDGKDQLAGFLSKALPPNQPVSLLCITGKGLKLIHPLTTDKNSLIQALGKTELGPETSIPHQSRITMTITQLREIAQAYAGIPGRKTMILAAGYIPELATERSMFESSPFAMDLNQMWNSLVDANISVYLIQLLDWARDPTQGGVAARPTDLLLRQFATARGGNLCFETNNLLGCLAEAVEDSRSYYMLGFSVQPNDRQPGWRDLKVKLSAEHVDVRARNGFYYGTPSSPSAKSARDEEIKALASSLAYSAVPMFVKVLPSPPPTTSTSSAPKKTTVRFLMTIPLSSVKVDVSRSYPLDLDVGAIALTSKTREAAELLHPVRGNPKPENLQQWTSQGIKLQESLDLPPGSYDIRFLVRDNNTGQIGTVVFPLDVK
jgi:VWFA-related protein